MWKQSPSGGIGGDSWVQYEGTGEKKTEGESISFQKFISQKLRRKKRARRKSCAWRKKLLERRGIYFYFNALGGGRLVRRGKWVNWPWGKTKKMSHPGREER